VVPEPLQHSILMADIEQFGRKVWTDTIRFRLRERFYQLLDYALDAATIEVKETYRADTGDGVLLLVTAAVSTNRLLYPLIPVLAERLAAANKAAAPSERLRLRLVVHAGRVIKDSHGYTSEAINHASRLLDAQAGRAILDAVPQAQVVLLVSEQIYQDVVKHGFEGIDPDGYQPVQLQNKETETRAWVHVPGPTLQPDLSCLAGILPELSMDAGTLPKPKEPVGHRRNQPTRRRNVIIAGILLGAAVVPLMIWLIARVVAQPSQSTGRVITVYNKVTNGATDMQEDTPAYLSTVTQNYCSRFGCSLSGTEVSSDAKLTAVCQTRGVRTTNGRDGSADDDANPNLYTSMLWYGIRWPDDRFGYISEVWVQASDRGGLGLPTCSNR
jgi:class 3 adenylate cyclase